MVESEKDGASGAPVTERRHADGVALDTLASSEVVRFMAVEERESPAAVERAAQSLGALIDASAEAIAAGGSLIFVGAGTSGRLGALEAAECPPTFGCCPRTVRAILAGGPDAMVASVEGAEDDADAGAQAIVDGAVCCADVVVGVSASGGAPFVRSAVRAAAELGAGTGFVTCNTALTSDRLQVDYPVVLSIGPEVVAGSTRLKAGTTTKIALNALTTAVFAKLGFVYGHLMVGVVPSNRKLERRALQLVVDLAGVTPGRAAELLAQANRRVKVAVVMGRAGVEVPEAEQLLAAATGQLRGVLSNLAEG